MAATTTPTLALPTAPTLNKTMYGPDYYSQIMKNYGDMASTALTSPEAANTAAKNRQGMAGAGVLSGSAYDVSQSDWAKQLQDSYTKQGLANVGTAQTQEAQYEADLPTKQLEATGQHQTQLKGLADQYKSLADTGDPTAAAYYNQIMNAMSGGTGTAYDYTKTEGGRTYTEAVGKGFGGYADPVTAFKSWLVDPNKARDDFGFYPGGTDPFPTTATTTTGTGTPAATTTTGTSAPLKTAKIKKTGAKVDVVSDNLPGIMNGLVIVRYPDGTTSMVNKSELES